MLSATVVPALGSSCREAALMARQQGAKAAKGKTCFPRSLDGGRPVGEEIGRIPGGSTYWRGGRFAAVWWF